MADVDFFKLYNHSNGHPAGDACLKSLANVIDGCCERPTDIVGRFGGEEFVLILPGTNNKGALMIAQAIQQPLIEKNIPYGPQNTNPVSLTMGIVSARGNTIDNIEMLIKEADVALYEVKEQGRNCVVSKVFSCSRRISA
ncbi:MAG: diguanylate cyclase (GGDEF)-like protein [Alphaproteobacteria bacterium]|jgi:diguanylate cyclase (GGDEF)-like protein